MKNRFRHACKLLITSVSVFLLSFSLYAQVPPGYYQNASGKSGSNLLNSITEIIDSHRIMSYSDLWNCFKLTDTLQNGQIWDIYSCYGDGTTEFPMYWNVDQCVSVSSEEGVCYNREHLFCQSWFGGTDDAPYSDLFHIYPVDGLVNTVRNNNPFGVVTNPSRTFANGSKYGTNSFPGAPSEPAFEPIDAYKGDIARSFFYMMARYRNEDATFASSSMTDGAQLTPWAMDMLMQWHLQDPVSPKEQARNRAVYLFQRNRNPFVDYPELVSKIWGADSVQPFTISDEPIPAKVRITHFALVDNFTAQVVFSDLVVPFCAEDTRNYDLGGTVSVVNADYSNDTVTLSLSGTFLQDAYYYLRVSNMLGENQLFMNDTLIPFHYNFTISQEVVAAWTFDQLPAKPSTPTEIPAMLSGAQSTAIFCNGEWGSSAFVTENTGNELNALNGTTLGDPRQEDAIADRALAFANTSANGKSFSLRLSTRNFYDLFLTFAIRRSGTGFKTMRWFWSTNGIDYQEVQNGVLQFNTDGEFQISGLDLRAIPEVDNCETLYLRAQIDGATSATGNLRIDNIVLWGNNITTEIEETENSENYFSIYPNPAEKYVNVKITDKKLEERLLQNSLRLQLLNLQGKVLQEVGFSKSQVKIDISECESGVYFLRLLDHKMNFSATSKLIVR